MRVPLFDPGAAISRCGQGWRIFNICVRAIRYGECALNPPTSQPIPRRRPSPAPAQRHAHPEHFRSPTQRRRTPAGCATHTRRPHNPFPAEGLRPPRALPLPHAAPMHARRLRDAFLAVLTTHSSPTSQSVPRRRPSPNHAQRHAPLPFRFGHKKRHRTVHVRCRMSRSTVVRSVIWIGEPRAVRRRCGALACRRGA